MIAAHSAVGVLGEGVHRIEGVGEIVGQPDAERGVEDIVDIAIVEITRAEISSVVPTRGSGVADEVTDALHTNCLRSERGECDRCLQTVRRAGGL